MNKLGQFLALVLGTVFTMLSRSRRQAARVKAAWRDLGHDITNPSVLRCIDAGFMPVAGGAGGTIEGQRGTGNVAANVLEVDYEDSIAELEPSAAPLTLLSSKMDKRETVNPKFNWFEDALDIRFDQINNGGGYNSAATSIVVDNGTYWQADDLIYVTRTGETMRVTAVSTNTLTVVRGVGSTAAAVNDNEELLNTGSAAQEGALDKPAKSSNPTEVFNYTQILRRPLDMTGTMRSTANRTKPHDWFRQLNKKGIEHAKDIELTAMFGHPSIDTTGANPRRTTGGFIHYCNQNITDAGGTLAESTLFSSTSLMFRYGNKSKLALSARVPVDAIHKFPRSKLMIEQSEETFGIRVHQVITPQGTLNWVTHWLLEGAVYGNHVWYVDIGNTAYRYLHGDDGSRDTHVRPEIQANGQDGRKDEYLTECGFEFRLPATHGRLVNVTGS